MLTGYAFYPFGGSVPVPWRTSSGGANVSYRKKSQYFGRPRQGDHKFRASNLADLVRPIDKAFT